MVALKLLMQISPLEKGYGLETDLAEFHLMYIQQLKNSTINKQISIIISLLQRFFDFFKAMISRIIYILHALLIVWRVTVVLGLYFWAFNIILLGIIAEALYVFIKREGKEWTW